MSKTTEQFEPALSHNPLGLSDSELDKAINSLLDYLDIDIQSKEQQEISWQYAQNTTTQKLDDQEDVSPRGLLSML